MTSPTAMNLERIGRSGSFIRLCTPNSSWKRRTARVSSLNAADSVKYARYYPFLEKVAKYFSVYERVRLEHWNKILGDENVDLKKDIQDIKATNLQLLDINRDQTQEIDATRARGGLQATNRRAARQARRNVHLQHGVRSDTADVERS
ncbi:hypothetical protein V7S43_014575 [Phytophthora oleae]|uniref:t-SNARE coiled-coil homology domain-containing protein n=1 Tax=Phytophthora oleae TaxID=2107226 RepID=A0ABD3F0U6_9STRA